MGMCRSRMGIAAIFAASNFQGNSDPLHFLCASRPVPSLLFSKFDPSSALSKRDDLSWGVDLEHDWQLEGYEVAISMHVVLPFSSFGRAMAAFEFMNGVC